MVLNGTTASTSYGVAVVLATVVPAVKLMAVVATIAIVSAVLVTMLKIVAMTTVDIVMVANVAQEVAALERFDWFLACC